MRELADSNRIEQFMRELGQAVKVEGHVYFAGGATAVLYGWRETTIDVYLKLIPTAMRSSARFLSSRRSLISMSSSPPLRTSFLSPRAGRKEVR
jgi:hypothetical protein